MKRPLAILLVLLAMLCAGWMASSYLSRCAGDLLRASLARAFAGQAKWRELEVGWSPLSLEVRELEVGAEAGLVAKLAEGRIAIDLPASLASLRLVTAVEIRGLQIDLISYENDRRVAPHRPAFPSFLASLAVAQIAALHARDLSLSFELTGARAEVRCGEVSGSALMRWAGEPQASFALTVTEAQLASKHEAIVIETGHAVGQFDHGALLFDEAEVRGPRIHLVEARQSREVPALQRVAGNFDLALLGVFVDNLRHLRGAASVAGILAHNIANPIADLQLDVRDGEIAGRPVGHLYTRVTRDGYDLNFLDAVIDGPPGTLSAAATIDFHPGARLKAHADRVNVEVGEVLRALGAEVPFGVVFNGSAEVDGPLDDLGLRIVAGGEVTSMATGESGVLNVSALAATDGVSLVSELKQQKGNLASARLNLTGQRFLGEIALSAEDLQRLARLAPRLVDVVDLGGRGQMRVAIDGPLNDPTFEARIRTADLAVAGAHFDDFDASLSLTRRQISLASLTATAGGGQLSAKGRVAIDGTHDNDWQLVFHDLPAGNVYAVTEGFVHQQLPLAEGLASGSVRVAGAWNDPMVRGEAQVQAAKLFGLTLDAIQAGLTIERRQMMVDARAARSAGEPITFRLRRDPIEGLSMQATAAALPLTLGIPGSDRSIAAIVSMEATATGAGQRATGHLEARLSEARIGTNALPPLSLTGALNGAALELQVRTSDGTIDTRARMSLDDGGAVLVDGSWKDLEITRWLAADRPLSLRSEGSVNLSGSWRDLAHLDGTIDVRALVAKQGDYAWALEQPLTVNVAGGTLRWHGAALAGSGSILRADGAISPDGEVRALLRGDANLQLLEILGPPITSAAGQSQFAIDVNGSLPDAWRIDGSVAVHDGVLDFGSVIVPTEIEAQLHFSGRQVVVQELRGAAGGGRFSATGTIDLNSGAQLQWQAERVDLRLLEDLDTEVSGNGTLSGRWPDATVTADLDVRRAVYERDIDLSDLFPAIRRRLLPAQRARQKLLPLNLDLHVHAPGGIFLESNVAKVEAAADLRIAGSLIRPTVVGTVQILEGEVTLRERRFTLTAGALDFRTPLEFNPVLDISGESRIETTQGDYSVNLHLSGTAETPRLAFSSDDPTLTQNDVLALVALGTTTSQLQRQAGGVNALSALALVPTSPLEKQLQTIGVDQFEIRAIERADTGLVEPQFRLGKRITKKMRASVASSIGVRSRRWVELEYDLTRRISILGSWEEESESQAGVFGGAVKFRYEFRNSPFSLLRPLLHEQEDRAGR